MGEPSQNGKDIYRIADRWQHRRCAARNTTKSKKGTGMCRRLHLRYSSSRRLASILKHPCWAKQFRTNLASPPSASYHDNTIHRPGSQSLRKPRSRATRKRTRLSGEFPKANRRLPVRRACDIRRARSLIRRTVQNDPARLKQSSAAGIATVGRIKPFLAAVETCPSYDSFSPANSIRRTMADGSTIVAPNPPGWQ